MEEGNFVLFMGYHELKTYLTCNVYDYRPDLLNICYLRHLKKIITANIGLVSSLAFFLSVFFSPRALILLEIVI